MHCASLILLEKGGYKLEKYNIKGMSCAACSARVQKAVEETDGVRSCSVNLLTNSMIVDGEVSPNVIIEAVKKAGYKAEVATEKNTLKSKGISSES